jgi:2-keto-4-pentenoate hydratase
VSVVVSTPAVPVHDAAVRAAADRLVAAETDRAPCPPVRDLIGRDDVDAAYAVQRVLHARALGAGRQVSGRKIGLTSPAVRAQLGVDQPDFGFLYADMDASADDPVDPTRLLQPRIEAEVAFVLGADLDGPLDDATVTAAVAAVVPALEIVASRVAGWDISFADTVADNGSAGLYVLGSTRLAPLEFGDDLHEGLAALSMRMTRSSDRGEHQQVSAGTGRDCLGSPLAALGWLAETAVRHGEPLRAGQVVLSGALGPMVPIAAGDEFHAEITGLGAVSARFAPTPEDR